MHKYIPHTKHDIDTMLEAIGVITIDDLFSDIDEGLRLENNLKLSDGLSELEVERKLSNLAKENNELTIFCGAGAYDHYIPSIIKHIYSRSEFYTAYTPYQPEISQGTLQYIFEFQSLICDLTNMYVTNASMYDGATATAEAMFMATAETRRNKILVSDIVNINIKRVIETYAHYRNIEVCYVNEKAGQLDIDDLRLKLDANIAALIVQYPNFYGNIEDYTEVVNLVKANKSLFIMNTELLSLGLLKTPGEIGADIVCGEAQSLGLPLNTGGPYLGYIASTEKLLRKMPGRICGMTKDIDGKRAYVLTLQAREQHIRREKATSNICSNQSLNALMATIYLSTIGKTGLIEINKQILAKTNYMKNAIDNLQDYKVVYNLPSYREFVVETKHNVKKLSEYLINNGILGGFDLSNFNPNFTNHLLICVTEKRTPEEINLLIKLMEDYHE